MNDFIVIMGTITFNYKTTKTQNELVDDFIFKIAEGVPFAVDMGGPVMIVNPSPGMTLIIMTTEQFQRNQSMARLAGKA